MSARLVSLALGGFLLVGASSLCAEDSEQTRGRMADGRAFRTDAKGNQLVDYIAELELSVEQLTRKVNGLEFELSERQKQVERLSTQGATERDISEKDLLSARGSRVSNDSSGRPGFAGSQAADLAACQKSSTECPDCDCSKQVAATQQLLEKANFDIGIAQKVREKSQEELQTLQARFEQGKADCDAQLSRFQTQMAQFTCPARDCLPELAPVKSELANAKTQLQETKDLLKAARTSSSSQVTVLSAQLSQYQNKSQTLEAAIADLKRQLFDRDGVISAKNADLLAKNNELLLLRKDMVAVQAKANAVASTNSQQVALAVVKNGSDKSVVPSSQSLPQKASPIAPVAQVDKIEPETKRATVVSVAQPKFYSDKPVEQPRAALSMARVRAVESLRGSLKVQLNQLRDLISTRDALFQGYSQLGRALTFKPSPLVSSRSNSVVWVSDQVKNVESVYELSGLARDIKEIKSRVSDDIALIKRMKRSAQ